MRGDWLPRTRFGRLHAVLAYVRCFVIALAVLAAAQPFQVVVLDQVSAPIALLRAFSAVKARVLPARPAARRPLTRDAAQVLFYCHFPDMLLATRSSRLRAAYRAPLDALEQRTTGMVRERVSTQLR